MDCLKRASYIYSYGWSFGDTDFKLLATISNFVKNGNNKKLMFYSHGIEKRLTSVLRASCDKKIFTDEKREEVVKKLQLFNRDISNVYCTCDNEFKNI